MKRFKFLLFSIAMMLVMATGQKVETSSRGDGGDKVIAPLAVEMSTMSVDMSVAELMPITGSYEQYASTDKNRPMSEGIVNNDVARGDVEYHRQTYNLELADNSSTQSYTQLGYSMWN